MKGTRRILRNWGFLTAARLIALASSIFFVLFIARKMGPVGYGQYFFILTFTSYFAFLSEFSLDRVIIQRVAAQNAGSGACLINSLIARAGLSCLAILCILFFMRWSSRPELSAAIALASWMLLTTSIYNGFSAIFQAHERMELVALIEIPFSLLRSGVGVLVVISGGGIFLLLSVLLIADILRALAGLIIYFIAFHPSVGVPKLRTIWSLICAGIPLSLSLLGTTVEFRTPIIVLARYWDDKVLGWFSVPYKIMDMIGAMILALSGALLPVLSRKYMTSRKDVAVAFNQIVRLLLIVLLPLAIGVTILARRLVVGAFGAAYADSVRPLQLIIWVAVLMSMQFICGTIFLASGRWSQMPLLTLIVALTSILAAFVFIPKYGHIGASIALLISEATSLTIFYFYIKLKIGIRLNGRPEYTRHVLCLVAWSAGLWILRDANTLVLAGLSLASYVFLIYLFRIIRNEDLLLAKELLPRRIHSWIRIKDAAP
jgi:O-antigen/teichoic acid export membrane protein